MKLLTKIARFMYGRYGTDNLNHFLFILYILVFIINLFLNQTWLFIIELLLVLTIFSRTLSKNINQRKKENQIFLKWKECITKPFQTIIKNWKDKDHIYKKCCKCKTVLRLPLPSKRGIKHTKCPTCKKRLTIFAFKYQKIEIIRNKKEK